MKSSEVKYFAPEEEYTRYIIGRFKDEALVPILLKYYSELCTDSPKISEYYKQEEWVIIPCPIQLINRGCFLDLAGWLSQKNDRVFAVAIHPNKCYFSKREKGNKWGDTGVVGFDDGIILRWLYPDGLVNDSAFYEVDPETLEPEDMIPWPCKEFLSYVGAEKLIKHFKN